VSWFIEDQQSLLRVIRLSTLNSDSLKSIVRRFEVSEELEEKVKGILRDVRERGDDAVRDLYESFYGISRDTPIRVSVDEFSEAYGEVSGEFVEVLRRVASRIKAFSEAVLAPLRKGWWVEAGLGVRVGQFARPVDSVGIYVPGGKYAYPSTALMTAVPALAAGVGRVVACTPPRGDGDASVDPAVLVALDVAGVKEVFRVGGAHAVAAMAYGTETVPRVAKLVGPGGPWFTAAKSLVLRDVAVDMIAGPSEIVVLADASADPALIAADLVAQAEHGPDSAAVLVTTSGELVKDVVREVRRVLDFVGGRQASVAEEALRSYGLIVIADSLPQAVWFVNEYGPEHLEVMVEWRDVPYVLSSVRNAGSVFVGEHAAVALGDYVLGTNHVIPTGGWCRVRGPLSPLDFIKFIDVQYVSAGGLASLAGDALTLAEREGFKAHAFSIKLRLERLNLTSPWSKAFDSGVAGGGS